MKRAASVILALALATATFLVAAQTPNINDLESTPREFVEQLWSMATQGELLTTPGWTRASRFFTKPMPPPGSKIVVVLSNYYGIMHSSVKDNSAEVEVEFEKLGQIDSDLRFVIAPPAKAYKTFVQYHLVAGHRYMLMYGLDGKTLIQDKEILESRIWQIKVRKTSHGPR